MACRNFHVRRPGISLVRRSEVVVEVVEPAAAHAAGAPPAAAVQAPAGDGGAAAKTLAPQHVVIAVVLVVLRDMQHVIGSTSDSERPPAGGVAGALAAAVGRIIVPRTRSRQSASYTFPAALVPTAGPALRFPRTWRRCRRRILSKPITYSSSVPWHLHITGTSASAPPRGPRRARSRRAAPAALPGTC